MRHIRDYMTSSSGHQVSSGVSKPISWHKCRQAKINSQLKFSSMSLSVLEQVASPAPQATAVTPINSPPISIPSHLSTSKSSNISAIVSLTQKKKLFTNCSIYISGSTAPYISDHSLKILLATHGAHISTMIKRKSTTHVIVGLKGVIGSGAGGGMAAGKLQKEISGKISSLKYVNVQWVLDSVKAGKRLSEIRYSGIEVRNAGQKSITDMFNGRVNNGASSGTVI